MGLLPVAHEGYGFLLVPKRLECLWDFNQQTVTGLKIHFRICKHQAAIRCIGGVTYTWFGEELLLNHLMGLWPSVMMAECSCNTVTNYTAIYTVYSKASVHNCSEILNILSVSNILIHGFCNVPLIPFSILILKWLYLIWISESEITFRHIQLMILFHSQIQSRE